MQNKHIGSQSYYMNLNNNIDSFGNTSFSFLLYLVSTERNSFERTRKKQGSSAFLFHGKKIGHMGRKHICPGDVCLFYFFIILASS